MDHHPDLPDGTRIIGGILMMPSTPIPPGVVQTGQNDSGLLWSDGARREWVPYVKPPESCIDIYDTNNFVRKIFEKATGNPLRQMVSDAYYNTHPSIYVFDGKGAKLKRREIFPGYKGQRPPAPDNFYHLLNFFKELLHHTRAVIIEVEGYEADDVIGHIADRATRKTEIKSTDADYLAKCNDLVSAPLSQAGSLAHIPACDIRLYKTVVGDNSDNVKGIRLFGKKSWEQMTEQGKDMFRAWLEDEGELEPLHFLSDLCRQSHLDWCLENKALLQSYWNVVGFLPMSPELVASGMTVGKPDWMLIDSKLKDIFL